MELLTYIVVTFFGISFSLNGSLIKSSKLFFFIWFIVYFILAFIVRSKFDSDINNYANSMDYTSIASHRIKEPIVWLGHRYIYALFKDAFTVFMIYDLIFGILLFKALKNFNLPK